MPEFETTDISGEICRFQYIIENSNDGKILFKIYSIPKNEMRWFTHTFIFLNQTLKSENMSNNGYSEFSKKGIPEKIIEIASSEFNSDVISSPITPQPGNFLVDTSFKVWQRLVLQNKNSHQDNFKDRFMFKKIKNN